LLELTNGEVTGTQTPVGIIPTKDELNLNGVDITPDDLETILTIDTHRWRQEIAHRGEHLAQFTGLPEQIWQAHRRVAAALKTDVR
jgi:phosphoenolpyruvate carboxykinase (GTP)